MPVAMMPSASAPFAPGYAMVRHSQPMKNASMAMQVASRPARLEMSFFSILNRPDLFSPMSDSSKSAKPESIADATKIGAMMAEYHSLASCRPKIHAVTLCTRMATGSAKRDTIDTLCSAPGLFEHMNTR